MKRPVPQEGGLVLAQARTSTRVGCTPRRGRRSAKYPPRLNKVVTNMATTSSKQALPKATRKTRAKDTRRRGNFYDGVGISLLVGLLVVVGLGVFGITSFGWFSLSTGMAMIGLSIGLLAVVSFITLMSMRRTLNLVTELETGLSQQAQRQDALTARLQAERKAVQVQRDRDQDLIVAELARRQDKSEVDNAAEAKKNKSAHARADRIRGIQQRARNGEGDPFKGGDVHPVEDVEGIAEYFGPLLEQADISTSEDLWHADTGGVALALDVSPIVVEQWKCQCELMAIDGVGKQYAELVVRAGVSSIRELASQDPNRLLDRIDQLEGRVDTSIQGNTIGLKTVETWIASAGSHHDARASAKATGAPGGVS